MPSKDKEKTMCWGGTCHKCKGWKMLILGILVLLNAYMAWFSWAVFVGGISALQDF